MKLRLSFSSHQTLFALYVSLVLTSGAFAQDKITTKDGRVQDGKVVGVVNGTVQVQIGAGTVGVPAANIAAIVMAPPPEFAAGQTAYEAKDYAKALPLIKSVADRFKGLPASTWAQQATSFLGDIYVALNKLPEAEAAYLDFQKVYGQGSIQADIGLARIAVSKSDFAGAQAKLTPIIEAALKQKTPPPALAPAYSQAFFLMGAAQENQKDYQAALENYLRTVTLFYHDRSSVEEAQVKAEALQKRGITVP